MDSVLTCLWFDGNALAAARFYRSVLGDKVVIDVPDNATAEPTVVPFAIAGQRFIGLNGGPQFPLSECVSIQVLCDDQTEVDRFWDGLLADGGREGQCGWLKDKYGLSWQIVPVRMMQLLQAADPVTAQRITDAFMPMHKLDLAAIEHAAAGE